MNTGLKQKAWKSIKWLLVIILAFIAMTWLGALLIQHVGIDAINNAQNKLDSLAIFFFLFRLGLYGLVWYYWPALTRRAGSKREWSEEKTDLVISERYKMIPWLLVLEALISGPIIMRQFA